MTAAQLPSQKTLAYWGRRGGSVAKDGSLVFKIKRGTNTGSNNSHAKAKHYTWTLVQLARARGFVNGVSIRRVG